MNLKTKIKLILKESLGVPDEIKMIVKAYTDLIIDKIKSDVISQTPKEFEVNFDPIGEHIVYKYQTKISGNESWEYLKNSPFFNEDYWRLFPTYRNKIEITVIVYPKELFESKNVKSPQIEASHVFSPSKFQVKTLKTKGEVYDISNYEFNINLYQEQFENIDSIRPRLSSVVAHEVFHSYQLFKRYKSTNKVGYGKETAYNKLTQILNSTINPEWNKFMRAIYYSLRFEQQARIPQTYFELKNEDIKNYEDFIREIQKTDVYKEIQFLKNFSSEEMINSITKISSFEDLILQGSRSNEFEQNLSNWDDFLKILRIKLNENGMNIDPFRTLSPKVRENPKLFFEYWERFFNKRGDDMFKKIVKIYDKIKK
jgi:hypothetical protein